MSQNDNRWIEGKELAEYLGIAYGTLRNLIKDDAASLPPYNWVGKTRRWRLSVVNKWLEDTLERPNRT